MSTYDTDGDGWLDAGATDTTGDGILDQNALDTNGDQVADTWLLDADQDGLVDARAYDTSGNGVADVVDSDVDENGITELRVIDQNEDRVPDGAPVGNIGIAPDGSMVIASPWADSSLPDLSDPAVVDEITGAFGDDIIADLENGPAHQPGADSGPVDGVDVATGLSQLDAAAANMSGTVPSGTVREYDPSTGTTFREPGDVTPDPWTDGIQDGY